MKAINTDAMLEMSISGIESGSDIGPALGDLKVHIWTHSNGSENQIRLWYYIGGEGPDDDPTVRINLTKWQALLLAKYLMLAQFVEEPE